MRPAPASERSHLSAVGEAAIRQFCSPPIRSTARVGCAFTLAVAAYPDPPAQATGRPAVTRAGAYRDPRRRRARMLSPCAATVRAFATAETLNHPILQQPARRSLLDEMRRGRLQSATSVVWGDLTPGDEARPPLPSLGHVTALHRGLLRLTAPAGAPDAP
jgi:hypothetical protein